MKISVPSEPDAAQLDTEPHWRRVATGAGAAMFLCMALGRFSYSAMIPALVESGELDTISAGYVGGANLAGFLAGAALSTVMVRWIRLDRFLMGAIAVTIIALFASALPWGGIWLGAWRAAIGAATGIVMVQGLALVAISAPAKHRPLAMSYIFIGVGSGILFGATIVPASLQFSIEAAWLAVAVAGLVAGAVAARAWRDVGQLAQAPDDAPSGRRPSRNHLAWFGVIAASTLFSIGIVPHTIYWFDFLARELGHGQLFAGWHWIGVGIFAIAGPILAARLAAAIGTISATTVSYFIMAVGIALPWFSTAGAALVASTVIFGAQPAVSTLLGARARDLGSARDAPRMMRTIILANGIGSGLGGIAIPKLLELSQSYELLFVAGGIAFLIGGLISLTMTE